MKQLSAGLRSLNPVNLFSSSNSSNKVDSTGSDCKRGTTKGIACLCGIALIFLGLTFSMGCGSGSSSKGVQAQPTIAASSGTPQTATVNAAFSGSLVATVTTGGSPTSGVIVTFTAPSTGASGTFAGGVNTATTNASGVATSAVFTANGIAGAYTVRASISGSTANFSLTNAAGAAASITATSGASQSVAVNGAFSAPLVVTVKDSSSNPVSGVTVTFTAPSTGASGTFAGGVNTATTDANGVATSAAFTANSTAGTYTVRATAAGVSTPATFSLTNNAGVAASVTATSGSAQSAAVNAAFALPLVVTVRDSGSNPVSGVTVTFTAPSTGASGSFAGGVNTATTNASGVATSAGFTANGTAGIYTVSASVAGVSTPASFSLTNIAGGSASITPTSGAGQSAAINTAFALPLVATVLDASSNPVSGATVTFSAPATGATGTFAGGVNTATTNASGVATSAAFTANATDGTYTVMASVSGVSTPASFSLTNIAGAAASITATSGTPQSVQFNTSFGAPLVATVLDAGSNPVSGATVTFTAPASGPSGTFAGGVNTATTDSNGVATSPVFTANANIGSYTVTASVSGVTTPASFSLTNTGVNYSFFLNGLQAVNDGPNYYALAGAISVDGNGTVLGGEQDYNDGFGFTSPEPSGDTITGGTLTVDPVSGEGTLTLITNNPSFGVNGTETLGVQFVNTKHALVVQFDGSATSSGSMDYQTLSGTIGDGNYAFAVSGVDTLYRSIVVGGVFSITSTGTTLQGIMDVDDAANGSPTLGTAFGGTVSSADAYGRGSISGTGIAGTLNYYIVNPRAMRIIDADPSQPFMVSDTGIGSAFSQGTGAFSNASLGSSVFGIESNSFGTGSLYAAAGQFTVPASGTFVGVGDDDELGTGALAIQAPMSGTYSIAANGYGNLTIQAGDLGNVSVLGIYMTDPTLNLNDPNNTTSGLGGGLIADLDDVINGTGFLVPQTDSASASFSGTYAFGSQDYYSGSSNSGEFDFIGQGSVTTGGVLSGTGIVSDPFFLLNGTSGTNLGAAFSGTATPDLFNPGRYTMPFTITVGVCSIPTQLQTVIYQSSGSQLFWIDLDAAGTALGIFEQQGSLTSLPAINKPAFKRKAVKKAAGVKPNC